TINNFGNQRFARQLVLLTRATAASDDQGAALSSYFAPNHSLIASLGTVSAPVAFVGNPSSNTSLALFMSGEFGGGKLLLQGNANRRPDDAGRRVLRRSARRQLLHQGRQRDSAGSARLPGLYPIGREVPGALPPAAKAGGFFSRGKETGGARADKESMSPRGGGSTRLLGG